jgi:D-alanine-D-alanine ligase
MKIRVGIFFGGSAREREISFAGGRTVYDNLNKDLFEPVPIFVDSFGNLCLIHWPYIYKGSIRDFYPEPSSITPSQYDFQVYAESINLKNKDEQIALLKNLGTPVMWNQLVDKMDIAFLCLHGSDGEDGRIQGMLEWLRIPYTGSGILSSAIGMNKAIQKQLMQNSGFDVQQYCTIKFDEWKNVTGRKELFEAVKKTCTNNFVVKAANQGSSIGISACNNSDFETFIQAVDKAFFIENISASEWNVLSQTDKTKKVRQLADIREGIGMPVLYGEQIIYHPDNLFQLIEEELKSKSIIQLQAVQGESEVLIESFIEGKEFSCIVIADENGKPIALPPTEIRKGKEVFDYRAKYLPGLSRKITPIELPIEQIERISTACEKLFSALFFDVYARIDGFMTHDGRIILNDPNTSSGMLPSSFFFHQAAEIGLNPSQFLTYIIRNSIRARIKDFKEHGKVNLLLQKIDIAIDVFNKHVKEKIRVAVLMGGYSSERHISIESGRNIYEKLASSAKYTPFPVFVSGNNDEHVLHAIPINVMLKDNADDILEKVNHYKQHDAVLKTIIKCSNIKTKYTDNKGVQKPHKVSYNELKQMADVVFIALHGRPGEDGQVQQHLDALDIPYNGSGVVSSKTTINKYETNEILLHHNLKAARHDLFYKDDWADDENKFIAVIEKKFPYPFIAKPVDDGCSSAVKVVRNSEVLRAFCKLLFRKTESEWNVNAEKVLHLKPKEEFPVKQNILIEELITANGCDHFLEITGGMLMKINDKGEKYFDVFEASEALSEGDILSLEEKFLAGQGQNITPARYSANAEHNAIISQKIKEQLGKAATLLKVEGYCRIDAFVRINKPTDVEVVFIEVNSLPGMTPATCIYHQAALDNLKPYDFIDGILDFAIRKKKDVSQS